MKRLLLLSACAASLAVPAPAVAAGCPGEDDLVTSANIVAAELAMACLVNQFRQAKGLSELLPHSQLAAAARAHSEDMDARDYFDDISLPPSSTDFQQRAIAAGYPSNAGVGENIASSPSATPDVLMQILLASDFYRSNMLNPDYKAAGYGVAAGSPIRGSSTGGLVTQLFGTETEGGTGGTGIPGGGRGSCPKAERLAGKLKRLKKNGAAGSKISKTKKALKKARKACS